MFAAVIAAVVVIGPAGTPGPPAAWAEPAGAAPATGDDDDAPNEADGDADDGDADNAEADEPAPEPAPALLAGLRTRFGDDIEITVDRARRLIIASSELTEPLRDYVRNRLQRYADALRTALLDARPARYISVVFLDRRAFRKLQPDESIGGWYDFGTHTLVALNLGYTLQHEFTHALHVDVHQQRRTPCPYWLLEGLATAFEDAAVTGDGKLVCRRSSRMTVLRRNVRRRRTIGLAKLFAMTAGEFQARHADAYPEAGYFVGWLHETGKLRDVYQRFLADHEADPTGAKSVAAVLGEELDAIGRRFHDWVREQPDGQPLNYQPPGVPLFGVRGATTQLGLRALSVRDPAKSAGIGTRDTILEIDGLAVTNQAKLNEALAVREPGDEVEVTVLRRRGGEVETVKVKLTRGR
jgi:hypothetical protein